MSKSTSYVPRTMDRRIRIERGVTSRDASGAEVLSWELLCIRDAAMIHKSGTENTSANKETASRSIVFTTRYVNGITEKDRISYENQLYDIVVINELGRRHMHEIVTEYRK